MATTGRLPTGEEKSSVFGAGEDRIGLFPASSAPNVRWLADRRLSVPAPLISLNCRIVS
jgi:hypothetical protein